MKKKEGRNMRIRVFREDNGRTWKRKEMMLVADHARDLCSI